MGPPFCRFASDVSLGVGAADRVLSQPSAVPLQYGAMQGFGPFLEGLAGFLSTQAAYGGNVDPATLFLAAGASQAVDLAATLFAGTGDTVLVEEPTDYLIERILIDHGLNVFGVPTGLCCRWGDGGI